MKESIIARGAFFVGLVTSGLLALIATGGTLPSDAGDSVSRFGYAAASPMALLPSGDAHTLGDNQRRQLPVATQTPAEAESALLLTIPPLTGVPTLPSIETLIPETPELPLPSLEVPALPTVPPVLSSPAAEPSATPTPTPVESDTEQAGRRLRLLAGLGLAVLCGGGILVGVLVLFGLRRRGRRAAPADARPSPADGGQAMLIVPDMDPIVLGSGATTIGRSEDSDIIIEDEQVSRYHARIECAGGVCTVEDLQSANGSFLNGHPVSRAVLTSGDRLRIGSVDMTYRAVEREAPGAWLEFDGRRYAVTASGLTIGRSSENEVPVADRRVSRRHARIELRQGTAVIIDLDSANGTFVNGQRVQQHPLHDGDEIRIGDSRIAFRRRSGA